MEKTQPPHDPSPATSTETRWRQELYEFSQSTSVQAVRQITEPQPFILRRVVWMVILVAGFSFFMLQVVESVTYYLSSPTSVNIVMNYNDSLRFPAVTICNQNAFRMTEASERNFYATIDKLFEYDHGEEEHDNEHQEDEDGMSKNLTDVLDMSINQLYKELGHRAEDFIVSCQWEQMPCTADDFQQTLTDHGVCYTFNNAAKLSAVKHTTQTGALWGLRVRLNIEQYEYMMGPNSGAGVRVLVHEQQDYPLISDFGQSVPPGMHAFLGVVITEITDLKKPHGKCEDGLKLDNTDHYTEAACIQECKRRMVQEICHCSIGYLPQDAPHDQPACSVRQHLDCVVPNIGRFREYRKGCYCPYPCRRTYFNSDITYGDMSIFDIEKMLHTTSSGLQHRYSTAREVAQQVQEEMQHQNKLAAHALAQGVKGIDQVLDAILKQLGQMTNMLMEDIGKLKQRIWFHWYQGLSNVKFVVGHEYIRGWEVVDERTFGHVATGFWEVLSSFDYVLEQLNTTYVNATGFQRQLLWNNVDDRLYNRLSMVDRALSNLTRLNEAFIYGNQFVRYKVTLDKRYDLTFIPLHLLQFDPKLQKSNFERCEWYFAMYKTALQDMRQCGAMVVSREASYCVNISQTRDDFARSAKMVNYALFQFRDKVVEEPFHAINNIIEDLLTRNSSLWKEFQFFMDLVEAVTKAVEDFSSSNWQNIKVASEKFTDYTQHQEGNKSSLGSIFNSQQMEYDILAMQQFFLSLRSRSGQGQDSLLRLRNLYMDVFQVLVQEESTKSFYSHLHDDVVKYFTNSDNSTDYLAHFVALTNLTRDYIQSLTQTQLEALMNSDFVYMDINEKLMNITKFYDEDILPSGALDAIVDNKDEVLLELLKDIKEDLAVFTASTKLGFSFFRDNYLNLDVYMKALSYQAIEQQVAYDLIALWSDIGGSIGLFLGASAITVFEFLDVFIHTALKMAREKGTKKKDNKKEDSKPPVTSNGVDNKKQENNLVYCQRF